MEITLADILYILAILDSTLFPSFENTISLFSYAPNTFSSLPNRKYYICPPLAN